jgi:hypothetical protein
MIRIHFQLFDHRTHDVGQSPEGARKLVRAPLPGEPIFGTSAPKIDDSACYRRIGYPAESPCPNVTGPVLPEATRLFHPRLRGGAFFRDDFARPGG